MLPRSWFQCCLLLVILLAACQPIRPVEELTPTAVAAPAPAVPSTSTTGESDCPILSDQPLDLIVAPNWQEGEVRRYQASHSRTEVEEGKEQSTVTTSYAMTVTVLEANEEGFTMEWHYLAMSPQRRWIRLEYSTNTFGEFLELRNLDELEELLDPLLTQLLQLTPGARVPSPEEVPNEIIEQATTILANDLLAYHAIYGLYFTEATPHVQEQRITLPLINARGINKTQITPTRYDATKGCLHLLWQNDFEFTNARQSIFRRNQLEEENRTSKMQSLARFNLDLNTGWLQSIEIKRTNVLDGDGQIEGLSLSYVPPAE